MYDFLLVGAGLTNAVLAWRLKNEFGKRCLVIDKRNEVGGNCATYEEDGILVHKYGPHIFHTSNEEVWKFVNRFAKFNDYINSPLAVYWGKTYHLPFNMNTFHELWPDVKTAEDAQRKIALEKTNYKNPTSLERHALNMVGKTIYETFIKGYTEKQWGRPCSKLPASIIKRIPLRFEYNNNYFNDIYQGIPSEGYTKMVEKMLDGIEVKLGVDFYDDVEGWKSKAKHVFHSGMLDEYYDFKFGKLGYRSLYFHRRTMHTNSYQNVAVINWTERSVDWTRTIEHKKFDRNNKSELTVIDFEHPRDFVYGENEPYYPIPTEENDKVLKKYLNFHAKSEKEILSDLSPNVTPTFVTFVGRLGTYRYMDMDDCVEWALNFNLEELANGN